MRRDQKNAGPLWLAMFGAIAGGAGHLCGTGRDAVVVAWVALTLTLRNWAPLETAHLPVDEAEVWRSRWQRESRGAAMFVAGALVGALAGRSWAQGMGPLASLTSAGGAALVGGLTYAASIAATRPTRELENVHVPLLLALFPLLFIATAPLVTAALLLGVVAWLHRAAVRFYEELPLSGEGESVETYVIEAETGERRELETPPLTPVYPDAAGNSGGVAWVRPSGVGFHGILWASYAGHLAAWWTDEFFLGSTARMGFRAALGTLAGLILVLAIRLLLTPWFVNRSRGSVESRLMNDGIIGVAHGAPLPIAATIATGADNTALLLAGLLAFGAPTYVRWIRARTRAFAHLPVRAYRYPLIAALTSVWVALLGLLVGVGLEHRGRVGVSTLVEALRSYVGPLDEYALHPVVPVYGLLMFSVIWATSAAAGRGWPSLDLSRRLGVRDVLASLVVLTIFLVIVHGGVRTQAHELALTIASSAPLKLEHWWLVFGLSAVVMTLDVGRAFRVSSGSASRGATVADRNLRELTPTSR